MYRMFGRLLSSKNNFNYYVGGRCRQLAGTTTLAYRIVIDCTTPESVLESVSTFQLACSSYRQEILYEFCTENLVINFVYF